MTNNADTTYTVPDASCGHCVTAISEAVEEVDRVEAVEVDLETKVVTVRGAAEDAAVREAIVAAGYEPLP